MEPEPQLPADAAAGPIPTASMLRDLCECSAIANPYAAQLLKEEVTPAEGWTVLAEADKEPAKGIKVERLDNWRDRKPGMLRCTTLLPGTVPPRCIAQLMDDLALRSVWDDHIRVAEVIEHIGADELAWSRKINRSGTKAALGGLVSPRDFLSYGIDASAGEGDQTAFFSVSQPTLRDDCPEPSDAIRGEAMHFSLSLVPAPDGATTASGEPAGWTCEYVVQVELNGWLPRGPILSGTIESVRDFLRYLAVCDWSTIPQPEGGGGART